MKVPVFVMLKTKLFRVCILSILRSRRPQGRGYAKIWTPRRNRAIDTFNFIERIFPLSHFLSMLSSVESQSVFLLVLMQWSAALAAITRQRRSRRIASKVGLRLPMTPFDVIAPRLCGWLAKRRPTLNTQISTVFRTKRTHTVARKIHSCTVGHKSHDPCFHEKYMEVGVMTCGPPYTFLVPEIYVGNTIEMTWPSVRSSVFECFSITNTHFEKLKEYV